MSEDLVAADAREQLRRWDAGESIWSIEMGGLGPGYEQAIQVLAMELVRDNLDNVLPEGKLGDWGDATVRRINDACLGFSGAQVGAAKSLAYQWLKHGPKAVCDIPDVKDRQIQVSNKWPKVAA